MAVSLATVWEEASTGNNRKNDAPMATISASRTRFVLGMALSFRSGQLSERLESSTRSRPHDRRFHGSRSTESGLRFYISRREGRVFRVDLNLPSAPDTH